MDKEGYEEFKERFREMLVSSDNEELADFCRSNIPDVFCYVTTLEYEKEEAESSLEYYRDEVSSLERKMSFHNPDYRMEE